MWIYVQNFDIIHILKSKNLLTAVFRFMLSQKVTLFPVTFKFQPKSLTDAKYEQTNLSI